MESNQPFEPTENLFRVFFDNAPVGTAVTAPDGRFLLVNAALSEMLGYTMEEMQSLSFMDITHPDDLKESKECALALIRGDKETQTLDKRCLTKGKGYIWIRVTTRMIQDNAFVSRFFLAYLVDITEQKKSEQLAAVGISAINAVHEINNPLVYILYSLERLVADIPRLAMGMERCYVEFVKIVGEEEVIRALGAWSEVYNRTMFSDLVERARQALSGTNRIKEIARGLLGQSINAEKPERPSDDVCRGRVLVIDDERIVRDILTRMLKREHEVITAESGEEGKRVLMNDRNFDAVVCDLMMPKISGMDLHEWLVSEIPDLARQMVFVTGGGLNEKADHFLKNIDNVHLDKPFDAAGFILAIRDVVMKSKRETPKEPFA